MPFKTVGTLTMTMISVAVYLVVSQNKHFRKWLKTFRRLRGIRNLLAEGVSSAWVGWLPALAVSLFSLGILIHLKWFDGRYLLKGQFKSVVVPAETVPPKVDRGDLSP